MKCVDPNSQQTGTMASDIIAALMQNSLQRLMIWSEFT